MSQVNKFPTEEEFKYWLEQPVTKAFHKVLATWEAELKEQWASGAFTDQGQFATAISNAKAIGTCEACEKVRTLDYVTLIGELEDEQSPKQ